MTEGELGRRMTSAEFTRMLAYEREFGLDDGAFIAGQICAAIYRAFAGAKVSPADFAPIFKPCRRRQSTDEMLAVFQGIATKNNASVGA